MKNRLRRLLVFLFIALLLLVGLIFRQFVLAALLLPAATAVWLLLRIFVLSIHQQIFWWGAIVVAAVAAFGGLFARSAVISRIPAPDSNTVRDRPSTWRDSILLHLLAEVDTDTFRRDLMWVFTSLYLSRGQGKAKYQIRDEILEHRIPIPESIYAFLFFSPRPSPRRSFVTHPVERLRTMSESFTRAVQEWVARRTGRETTDRVRAIDAILTFMETSLEMRQENDAPYVPPVS
jgi:hypothetical protein